MNRKQTLAVSELGVTASLGAAVNVAVLGKTVVLGGLIVVTTSVAGT